MKEDNEGRSASRGAVLVENEQDHGVPVGGGGAFNELRSKEIKATIRDAYNMNVTQNES